MKYIQSSIKDENDLKVALDNIWDNRNKLVDYEHDAVIRDTSKPGDTFRSHEHIGVYSFKFTFDDDLEMPLI